GLFLDVLGDGVTGEAAAEFGHDLAPAFYWNLEVGGAADAIELVQVVGRHADVDQPEAELLLGGDRVVDAAEQDRLVQNHSAGSAQSQDGGGDFGVELLGVIGMDYYDRDESRAHQPI